MKILSILFFVASAMAKGRVTYINDNWDAPPQYKAIMSFQLIWAALCLVQFVWILAKLSNIPHAAVRGPYIMLAIVTFFAFLYYLLVGVWTRIRKDLAFIVAGQFSTGISALYAVVTAFQPAVVLWLIHQRGALQRASKEKTISPFTSQVWKQIADWVLVGITLIIYISATGNRAAYYAAINSVMLRNSESQKFIQANNGFGHTIVALSIVLAINVAMSAITLRIQGKRVQWNDLVTARVCYVVVPSFLIFALETLIFDIYYTKVTSGTYKASDLLGANLAEIIIEGACRIIITNGLIVTMGLTGVQWTATGGAPLNPASPDQWSNSHSKQDESIVFPTPQPYLSY